MKIIYGILICAFWLPLLPAKTLRQSQVAEASPDAKAGDPRPLPHGWTYAWVNGRKVILTAPLPPVLRTRADIESTPATTKTIDIGELPIALYPQLAKFSDLWEVQLKANGAHATDAKLRALAEVPLPKLRGVVFGGSTEVTDDGVLALCRFETLYHLQLTGAAVTDRVVDVLARFPAFRGVNLVQCASLSFEALKKAAMQRRWADLSFSADTLSTAQVAELLRLLPPDAYCTVEDRSVHLDATRLRKLAEQQHLHLQLRKDERFPGYE